MLEFIKEKRKRMIFPDHSVPTEDHFRGCLKNLENWNIQEVPIINGGTEVSFGLV